MKLDTNSLAHTQYQLPVNIIKEPQGKSAKLLEDEQNIVFSGKNFSYTFSKHYGMFTSIKTYGIERILSKPKQRRNIRTRLKRQYLGSFWIIGGGRRQPCHLHCTKNHTKFCTF